MYTSANSGNNGAAIGRDMSDAVATFTFGWIATMKSTAYWKKMEKAERQGLVDDDPAFSPLSELLQAHSHNRQVGCFCPHK
jgi:hypothetical protein